MMFKFTVKIQASEYFHYEIACNSRFD